MAVQAGRWGQAAHGEEPHHTTTWRREAERVMIHLGAGWSC